MMATKIPVYLEAGVEVDLNFRSVDDQPLMETSKASIASACAFIGLVSGVLVQTRLRSLDQLLYSFALYSY